MKNLLISKRSKKQSVVRLLLTAGLIFTAPASQALLLCDMHGSLGFGMYGKQSQSNSFSKSLQYDVAKVQLRHPYFTKSKLGESKTIEIKYTVPSQISDAKMRIVSSEKIKLEGGDFIALNQATGSHPVTFKANATGRHNLVLKVEGKSGDKPISMVRHIGLMISE